MNLILPQYLLQERRFKCPRCSFAFVKKTPSKVERCPMCAKQDITIAILARGVKKEELDPYSQWKLRIYSDPLGRSHKEDLEQRRVETRNGKDVVVHRDEKGRLIDTMYQPAVYKGKDIKNPILKFVKE